MHWIHLAVKWGRNEKRCYVQDHDHEGGKSRKGINLSRGHVQTRTSSKNSK
jgi:hypothetical protein